jgi:hypothetical protein
VLPTLNALPHVKHTVEALGRQTFRDFELIIQDGGSTDGTVAYVQSLTGFNRVDIDSRSDTGVGQAYNRGIARASGDYLGLIAADETLYPNALLILLNKMRERPDIGITYGSVDIIDAEDKHLQTFVPPPFDLLRFLHCEIFPSTAGLLSRNVISHDLFYDESLQTCPDYDFWIRIGSHLKKEQIVRVDDTIMTARGDRISMSFRPEMFTQFCNDKLFILERFIQGQGSCSILSHLHRSAACGIYCWCAEMIYGLEGASYRFLEFVQAAKQLDADAPRVRNLRKQVEENQIKGNPDESTLRLLGQINLQEGTSHAHWGAELVSKERFEYRGSQSPWGYTLTLDLAGHLPFLVYSRQCFLMLIVHILSGKLGIGLLEGGELKREQIHSPMRAPVKIFISLDNVAPDAALILRNGGTPRSQFHILAATIMRSLDVDNLEAPTEPGKNLRADPKGGAN